MQYEVKSTKIKVNSDYPTSIASEAYGANVGCIAFNIDYIVKRNPDLLLQLFKLYEECRDLRDKPELDRNDPIWDKAYNKAKTLFKLGSYI